MAFVTVEWSVSPITQTFGRWFGYSAQTAIDLAFVVVLTVWSRSAGRRLPVALVGLVLFGLQRLLVVPGYLRWTTDWTSDAYNAYLLLSNLVFYLSVVVSWSVSRRRTGFATLGVVPFLAIAGVASWLPVFVFGFGDGFAANVLGTVYDLAVVVLAIAGFWGADAIGMARRRQSTVTHLHPSGPAPYGYAPPGPYPGPGPIPHGAHLPPGPAYPHQHAYPPPNPSYGPAWAGPGPGVHR